MSNEILNVIAVAQRHGLDARRIAEEGVSEDGYWEFVTTPDGKRVTDHQGEFKKVSRRWPSQRAAAEILEAFAAKLDAEGR